MLIVSKEKKKRLVESRRSYINKNLRQALFFNENLNKKE